MKRVYFRSGVLLAKIYNINSLCDAYFRNRCNALFASARGGAKIV